MLCSSIDAILLSLNRCDFHYKIHSSFCSEVCIFQETTFCWAPSPPSAPVLQANHVRRQGENVEPRQGLRVRPSDRCCLLSFFFHCDHYGSSKPENLSKFLRPGLSTRKKEIEDLKVITVLLNSRDTVKVESEIYALRVSLENLKKEVSTLHSRLDNRGQQREHQGGQWHLFPLLLSYMEKNTPWIHLWMKMPQRGFQMVVAQGGKPNSLKSNEVSASSIFK